MTRVNISKFVERIIALGVHEYATGPGASVPGIKEEVYVRLWPKEVVFPDGYNKDFPQILLIDQTCPDRDTERIIEDGGYQIYNDRKGVLKGVPNYLVDGQGIKVPRAVLFWNFYKEKWYDLRDPLRHLGGGPKKFPLTYRQALWVMANYPPDSFRGVQIDILGIKPPSGGFDSNDQDTLVTCLLNNCLTDGMLEVHPAFRGEVFVSVK